MSCGQSVRVRHCDVQGGLIERNCSRINLGCKTVMVHLTEIILINSFQSKLIVLKISRGFLILIVYD